MNGSQAETPRKHILVVDDSRDNLRLLSGILIQEGYTVRPVLDGQLALSSAKTNPPDVILLDIMMPGMTGFDVCELLKTEPTLRDIPVIFISALNSVLDKVKAFSVGGVDYITKPFHPQEVLARIKTHLTLRHLQQSLQDNNQTLQREIAERRRIEAAMRQRNWELDLLNQLTNLLQGCQDERATYRVIANICQQLFPKISGGLYLLNDRQTEIRIAEYWGASPSSATVLTHPDWEMLTGQIITLEQPKDKPIQIYFSEARGNAAPPYALRGTDGEIFGMLFFDFEACDYETLVADSIQEAESRQLIATRVAEQYALFLSNLRMRAVLERQVTRDPLTDLYNRRYMEEALLNEMHTEYISVSRNLIDELSRFVCDPRGGETVTLTLDRDGAWEILGALAYGAAGVVLHEHHLTRVTEALETHAQTLLAPRPQPLHEAQACVARAHSLCNIAAQLRKLDAADLYRLAPVTI